MNKSSFYPKFALINLKKNQSIFLPYVMVCIIAIIMFYSLASLYFNPSLESLESVASLLTIFKFGLVIVGLFAVILFFYVNSFIIKRRQKEFGLYSVLGMGKRQIAKGLFFESLFISIGTIIVGIILGILVGRVAILAFVKASKLDLQIRFNISMDAVVLTVVVFILLFIALLLFNLLKIHVSNPITMLKGNQTGEREPRGSWIITIIGIAALAAGYYMALTIESPLQAFGMFFIAVVLVMVGTLCLFLAGSIAFLKALRANKSFYYKPNNFISVSGMIYRMKQNAAGLAAICILSTMVLVTISITATLYTSVDKVIDSQMHFHVEISYDDGLEDAIENVLAENSKNAGVAFVDRKNFRSVDLILIREGANFRDIKQDDDYYSNFDMISAVSFITIDDINAFTGERLALSENEVLIYGTTEFGFPSITYNDKTFKILEERDLSELFGVSDTLTDIFYVVTKNEGIISSVVLGGGPKSDEAVEELAMRNVAMFNIEQDDWNFDYIGFEQNLRNDINSIQTESQHIYALFYHILRQDLMTMHSGLLFIGIFLGIIFLAAAALIIYYKQISEGFQDHERFEIMQKVGLSKKEVKQTINRQILMVFFLPLITAIIHVFVASPMISKIVVMFGITEYSYLAVRIAVCVGIFAVLYAIIYKVTARAYYKLVE